MFEGGEPKFYSMVTRPPLNRVKVYTKQCCIPAGCTYTCMEALSDKHIGYAMFRLCCTNCLPFRYVFSVPKCFKVRCDMHVYCLILMPTQERTWL